MIKKFYLLLCMALLLSLAIPMAVAQEEETDYKEIMVDLGGANLRLSQLKFALEKQEAKGDVIVDYITDMYPDADTTTLEGYLNDISALSDSVNDMFDVTDTEELATFFEETKEEAREISKSFKEEARTILNEGDRESIVELVKEVNTSEMQDAKDNIKMYRLDFNANRMGYLLTELGVENDELVENIRNGDITAREARQELRSTYKELDDDEKAEVRQKLKEFGARRDVFAQRVQEKLETRSEKIQERAENARAEGLEKRAEGLEKRAEGAERRADRISDARERRDDRREARLNGRPVDGSNDDSSDDDGSNDEDEEEIADEETSDDVDGSIGEDSTNDDSNETVSDENTNETTGDEQ